MPPQERRALNAWMFHHVFAVARDVVGSASCLVVSPSRAVCEIAEQANARWFRDDGSGLNPALEKARQMAISRGADTMVALSCDLPLLENSDLAALLASTEIMAIAPDVDGGGTNALLTRRQAAIPYRFGPSSCQAHMDEAAARGFAVDVIRRSGLAQDLDLPGQLHLIDSKRGDFLSSIQGRNVK